MSATQLDRRSPPPAGPTIDPSFPDFDRAVIGSGLELIVCRQPGQPLVTIQYTHDGGAIYDPPSLDGLASLTAAMLDEGTELRSSTQIAEQVEARGGHLGSGCDWDAAGIQLAALREHLSFGLELVAELATVPSFPEEELERVRDRRLAELERRRSDPAALAAESFVKALYGGSAYGHMLLGDRDSVSDISRDDLVAFHRRHRSRGASSLTVVGDVETEPLRQLCERLFQTSESAPAELPEIAVEGPSGVRVHLVDRPEAAQTELRIGHLGIERTYERRPGLVLLNSILGGKFTSRINLNLRERNGYTYGASSRFVERKRRGPFLISTAVDNHVAGAATTEVLAELKRIREEQISDQEVDDARRYLLGVFPYTLQTQGGITGRLEELAVYRLPDDEYRRLPERLRAVEASDLLELARRHLSATDIIVVAVGPREQLSAQFEGLGTVENPAAKD